MKSRSTRSAQVQLRALVLTPLALICFSLPASAGLLSSPAELRTQGNGESLHGGVRSRTAQVDAHVLDGIHGPGDTLDFEMFSDVKLTGRVVSLKINDDGRRIITGEIEGKKADFILVESEGFVSMDVLGRSLSFEIRALPDGSHYVRERNPAAGMGCGTGDIDHSVLPRSSGKMIEVDPTAASRMGGCGELAAVNVMVLYTDNLRSQRGGTAAVLNDIFLYQTTCNGAFSLSDANVSIDVVHTAEINYTAPIDLQEPLGEMRFDRGEFSGTATLRDVHGADLVCLLVGDDDRSKMGIAYRSVVRTADGSIWGSPDLGFSVVEGTGDDNNSALIFSHVLGHNFGCQHNNEAVDSPFKLVYPFARGYQHFDSFNSFTTILGYPSEWFPWVANFSNPDVDVDGSPTGTAFANNALTLTLNAPIVASYRLVSDCDGNGVEDDCDLLLDPSLDCNLNGVLDSCEIADGSASDVIPAGGNGIPDNCEAPTLYVDQSATGNGSGTSWANAFTNLDDALAIASNPSNPPNVLERIEVAEGLYFPGGGIDQDDTYTLWRDVALVGGYPTGGGARDPIAHESILSGDFDQDDGPGIDSRRDNAYHVLTADSDNGVSDLTVIDGFIIEGGYADGDQTNFGGGGMYVQGGIPRLRNCTFRRCRSDFSGGAILIDSSADALEITNCKFFGNEASFNGGAVQYSGSGAATISNSLFSGNTAKFSGQSRGGALGLSSFTIINQSTFVGNEATEEGGAIWNGSGNVVQLRNSILWGNIAGDVPTGQIYDQGVVFAFNSCIESGGFSGPGTITDDPLFVDANGADNMYGTADDNVHLQPSSPAVDTGDRTFSTDLDIDLDGNPRVGGCDPTDGIPEVDMGCYELPGAIYSPELYVDRSASGDGSGSSWANAIPELRDALVIAQCFPGSPMTVRVAQGIYQTAASGVDTPTFTLTPLLSLIGGYPSGGGVWDPAAYPTILSGELGSPGNQADNADVVVTADSFGAILLEGLIIQSGGSNTSGAGVVVSGAVEMSMNQCTIRNNNANAAAGLLVVHGAEVSATNCTFENNDASTGAGGGALLENSVPGSFTNCLFSLNTAATTGGGLFCSSFSNVDVVNCTFVNNDATDGNAIQEVSATVTASNSIFWQTSDLGPVIAGSPTLEHSVTYGAVWPGTNNFNLDPLFVAAGSGDYRLSGASPYIDAGINASNGESTDLAGEFRFLDDCNVSDTGSGTGPIIDIGAYEAQPMALVEHLLSNPSNSTAWGDYDNDGDDDAFLSKPFLETNQLLRNDGNGAFVDVTPTNLELFVKACGVSSWGDFDNDGDLDLYVTTTSLGSSNFLMRNDGGGVFTDVTQAPLDFTPGSRSTWSDYDRDGDADLTVSGNGGAKVFRNDDDGVFVDVSTPEMSDLNFPDTGKWVDYDGDHDVDLFLPGTLDPSQTNSLFRNDAGVLVSVTLPAFAEGIGFYDLAFGDWDNDGDLDVVVAKESGVEIHENDGNGGFTDVTPQIVTDLGTRTGCTWMDHDNDGSLDLYLSHSSGNVICLFGSQENVVVPLGFASLEESYLVDWDVDGDVDAHTSGGDGKVARNASCSGSWLQVDLEGTVSNARGLGARIDVVVGGVTQSRWVTSSSGSHTAFFGVGPFVEATVHVTWPTGLVQTQSNVTTNQKITVTESVGSSTVLLFVNDKPAWDAAINAAGSVASSFSTTAANLALADELGSPPGANAGIGPLLTFDQTNTGLVFDFELRGINPMPGHEIWSLVYEDNEDGIPSGERLISIGDIDGNGQPGSTTYMEDDDFEIVFDPAGSTLPHAFGFTLNGNVFEAGEELRVYGPGDVLVATCELSQLVESDDWLPGIFIGLFSDEPITRVVFDENPGGDDIAIRDFEFATESPTSSEGSDINVVTAYALRAPAPNPFNPRTRIAFDLPTEGPVTLTVYDPRGRRVATLVNETMTSGRHEVMWQGRNHKGEQVAAGVYLYQLRARSFVQTRRMLLLN